MKWIRRIFRKKNPLRDKVVEEYGEDTAKLYDRVCKGETIGNYWETVSLLDKVEKCRRMI